ncbi:ABC transporter ATP-binding protein [Brevibacterium sp. CS2]|uniref:ABC transporter ATP-binding protein n=1 Tax=Brevibacterium sp. CS2 TaxID=2575923 RepID=UPI001586C9BB|nr:ABC transporter ATP-binding protein [Brevibacterium sp. CS2]
MTPAIRADEDTEAEELPPDIARRARRLLGSLARPYRGGIIAFAVVVALTILASVLDPVFVALALDEGLPRAADGDVTALGWAIGGFVGVTLLGGLGMWLANRLVGVLAQKIMFDLRTRLFVHTQRLDLGYHEKSTSGRLVSRQTSDMESVQQFLGYSLMDALSALGQMTCIAVILVALDWRLALVVFAGFIPLVFTTRAAQRTQRAAFRRTRTSIAKVIVHFVETMGGIRAVQAFRRQPHGRQRLESEDEQYRDANVRALRGVAWFAGSTRLIGNVTQAAVMAVGAWFVIEDWTQIGVLAAFVLYLRRFYGPLDELVQTFNLYQSASAALEKIAAVLDTEPTVEEPDHPVALPARRSADAAGRELAFSAVRFSYGEGPDILPTFDLRIPAGQTVALVGATGAGKSTLVKLVTRFYDPSAGTVAVDGVDLRDLADAALRRSIVMVTQESFLLSGTIADNIRIGRPEATDAEVEAAGRAVGLDADVARLPAGYATDVRSRGGRLSSGQRQLVSFARAFLADPDVIVLDEATAHLDIPSERLVQSALETVLAGRTAIIIAHRLSTVEIADRVLVMEAGRIIEDGEPAALIAGTGRFAALHRAWRDSLA